MNDKDKRCYEALKFSEERLQLLDTIHEMVDDELRHRSPRPEPPSLWQRFINALSPKHTHTHTSVYTNQINNIMKKLQNDPYGTPWIEVIEGMPAVPLCTSNTNGGSTEDLLFEDWEKLLGGGGVL